MNPGKYNERITLISETITYDEIGNTIKIPVENEVWAKKQSISQNEFYQAQVTGLKPELKFKIRSRNYSGEKDIKYKDKTYKVIRVYTTDDWETELTCQGVVAYGE